MTSSIFAHRGRGACVTALTSWMIGGPVFDPMILSINSSITAGSQKRCGHRGVCRMFGRLGDGFVP
eukprot:5876534-Prymnesium_polylepis.1